MLREWRQMPGRAEWWDGMTKARDLPGGPSHALRAFEVHALDYLLKPVDDRRFSAAVDRARKLVDSTSKTQIAERILKMLGRESEKYISRFVVRTGSRIQIVLAEDTEWIGAAGDYTELHVHGRLYLLRETMNFL